MDDEDGDSDAAAAAAAAAAATTGAGSAAMSSPGAYAWKQTDACIGRYVRAILSVHVYVCACKRTHT